MRENGNVLFLILIAVALFAALSYAVTSSTRSGGGDASKETLVVQSSTIIQYATAIQTAMQRMQISKGCDYTQIDFTPPSWASFATAPVECKVFHPDGGGVPYQQPKDEWEQAGLTCLEYRYTGTQSIKNIGEADRDEWALYLKCLTKEMCVGLNDKLGVTNPGGNPPVQDPSTFLHPVQNYTPQDWFLGDLVTTGNETLGHESFCMEVSAGTGHAGPVGSYIYVHTLMPR